MGAPKESIRVHGVRNGERFECPNLRCRSLIFESPNLDTLNGQVEGFCTKCKWVVVFQPATRNVA